MLMISIITSTTTNVSMADTMNYSFIVVIFVLIFLSLKKIIGEGVQNHHQLRMIVRNFNIVTIPLILIFTAIMTYQIIAFLP
jgi:hypothetical protein